MTSLFVTHKIQIDGLVSIDGFTPVIVTLPYILNKFAKFGRNQTLLAFDWSP